MRYPALVSLFITVIGDYGAYWSTMGAAHRPTHVNNCSHQHKPPPNLVPTEQRPKLSQLLGQFDSWGWKLSVLFVWLAFVVLQSPVYCHLPGSMSYIPVVVRSRSHDRDTLSDSLEVPPAWHFRSITLSRHLLVGVFKTPLLVGRAPLTAHSGRQNICSALTWLATAKVGSDQLTLAELVTLVTLWPWHGTQLCHGHCYEEEGCAVRWLHEGMLCHTTASVMGLQG